MQEVRAEERPAGDLEPKGEEIRVERPETVRPGADPLAPEDRLGTGKTFKDSPVVFACSEELVVCSSSHDPSPVNYDDHIGLQECSKPLCDCDAGSSFHHFVQCLSHEVFRLCINRADGVIQEQDLRVLQ